MKFKISVVLAVFALVIFGVPLVSKAESAIDQQCTSPKDEDVPLNNMYAYQTFAPSMDHLTSISLFFDGTPGSLSVALKTNAGATLWSGTQENPSAQWYSMSVGDLTVTPGATYKIVVGGITMNATWGLSHSASCYLGGAAYLNDAPYTGGDWLFKTYGYNTAAPTPTPTGDTTNNSTSTTSASIAKPTGGKAEFVADSNKVKISWTKSTTTDIDGYRIYRSETKTKGFTKLADVNKSTLEYLDAAVTAEKTYYYYIRAFKGNSESYSSDTLTVVVPVFATATTAPATATATATTSQPRNVSATAALMIYIAGSLLILVLGGYLFYKWYWPKIKAKRQAKV